MLRFFVWSSCLLLLACGNGQVAKTTSVTNGSLVLGVVPLNNGDTGDSRRYRLLLCKHLPEYNTQVFADTSKCRSALLTQDGKEVDLIGWLAQPTNAHLDLDDAKMTDRSVEIGLSPLALVGKKVNNHNHYVLPQPTGMSCRGSSPMQIKCDVAEYSRTDLMTSQNWGNIYANNFRNITSLEKRGDVRAILVAMARFFTLKVNESALQLETL